MSVVFEATLTKYQAGVVAVDTSGAFEGVTGPCCEPRLYRSQ